MLFGGILGHLWKDLGKQNSADTINQLLDYDKSCSVQKLLDEDHTLPELRNNNQRLINYFNHQKVLELLHYIVVEPDQDSTHKRGHRYPFVASDLFGVEQNSMLDAFFKETEVRIPIDTKHSVFGKGKDLMQSPQEAEQDDKKQCTHEVQEEGDEEQEQLIKDGEQDVQQQQNLNGLSAKADEEAFTIMIPSPKALNDQQNEGQQNEEKVLCDQQLDQPGFQSQKQLPTQEEAQNKSQELSLQQPVVPQKFINSEQEVNQKDQEVSQEKDEEIKDENNLKQDEEEPKQQDGQVKAEAQPKEKDQQIEEPVPNPPAQQSLPQLEEIKTEQLQNQEPKDDLIPISINIDDQEEKLTVMTGSTQADTEDQKFDIVIKYQCLELLFSFVSDTQKQLNPVLCGYFSRIVNSLLNKRLKQLAEYLFSHFRILQNMVSHLESRSIYELVVRILKIDQQIFDSNEIEISVYKSRMLSCLIEQLSSNNSKWENLNSSQVLCEIIQNSKLWSIICSNSQFLKVIITNIINPGSTSSLHSSLKVFGSIVNVIGKWKTYWQKALGSMQQIDYQNAMSCIKAINDLQVQYCDNYDYEDEAEDEQHVQDDENSSKKIIKIDEIFEKIFELYDEDNHSTQLMSCSYGRNIIPFGKTRLLVSKVIKSAIQIQSQKITCAVIKSRILQKLMSYVHIYEWNNMLHVIADNVFTFILSGSQIINSETTYKLKRHLLFEIYFIDWLAQLSTVPRFQFDSSNRKLRTGYMPFVHKFSNQLVSQSKTNPEIENLLNESQMFMIYKKGDLEMMNQINSRPLGGLKTGQSKQEEKEQSEQQKDDLNVSFSVDDIYKQYNELSARYNSQRSSNASSINSQQDSGALEDEEQEQDEELELEEGQEFDQSQQQGKLMDLISQSPIKKQNIYEFQEESAQQNQQFEGEKNNKCSIKLGTQDSQQDIYQYEDYQKRFTQTMKNITTSQDDQDGQQQLQEEEEDLSQRDTQQNETQLTALFMEKKLIKDRQRKNIRLRYQEEQQEDEKQEEDDMNDRDQETDQLFKYAEEVSQNSSEVQKKRSINPFQSPDKEIFVSQKVKSMSFGEKKLHLELKPASPEKNSQFFSNNFWKVDLNQNYDLNQLLKDFI